MIYDVNRVSFAYGTEPVLKDVSLQLREGEIITVLGRNGAGKSTLLSCLLGMLRPQSGEIFLDGQNLNGLNERRIAKKVGYVPQLQTAVFSFTVLDYVMMGCACELGLFARPGKKERLAAEQALDEMGILHLRDRPFPELSGGEQQQATIARAVVRHPKAVLLDEPTSHLDVPNQIKVLRKVRRLSDMGYAVMFTTHNPDHALLLGGSTVLFDHAGGIRAGAAADVVTAESLRAVYGSDLKLTWVEEIGRTACLYPGL